MPERLTRKALYNLVWSEPTMTLATRFGISDIALKKTCARAGVPTPERGYWAKKDAGKEVIQLLVRTLPGIVLVLVVWVQFDMFPHWEQTSCIDRGLTPFPVSTLIKKFHAEIRRGVI